MPKLLTRRVIRVGGSLGVTVPQYIVKGREVLVICIYEDDEVEHMISEGVV